MRTTWLALGGVIIALLLAACGSGSPARSVTAPAARAPAGTAPPAHRARVAVGATARRPQGSGSAVNLANAPLPQPTGTNLIGAASSRSLFKAVNLAPVLADLRQRLGAQASLVRLELYPGEIDLVVDRADGVLQVVRIERDGAISEGQRAAIFAGPETIYLSQLSAPVPQQLAAQLMAHERIPISRLQRMVLVTSGLPDHNAGWRIYASGGRPGYLALLDGSGLKQV